MAREGPIFRRRETPLPLPPQYNDHDVATKLLHGGRGIQSPCPSCSSSAPRTLPLVLRSIRQSLDRRALLPPAAPTHGYVSASSRVFALEMVASELTRSHRRRAAR